MIIAASRGPRWAVNAYLLVIGSLALLLGARMGRIGRNWTLSDWLINYQAGFVRRGLPGEVIFLLHRWLHLPLAVVAAGMWLCLELILLMSWRQLAVHSANRAWVLALLLSPATLAFSVLDPGAGFRKEMVLLGGFSAFVALLGSKKVTDFVAGAFMAVVLLVAILSHESSIFFAPYFLAALVVGGRDLKRACKICVVPFVIAFLAAAVSAKFRGDLNMAARICTSLGYTLRGGYGDGVCDSGAIAFLQYSTAHAFDETLLAMHKYHYLTAYSVLAILSLAPILAGSWELRRTRVRGALLICWLMAALSFIGSILLFVVAQDWGRWIHMHVMCLGALMLVLGASAEPAEGGRQGWAVSPVGRFATVLLLIVYAIGWKLNPVYGWSWHFAYGDVASQVREMVVHRTAPPSSAGLHCAFPLGDALSCQLRGGGQV